MRVGIVYTSTTPELIETVNTELKKQLGEDVEFLNYEDLLFWQRCGTRDL